MVCSYDDVLAVNHTSEVLASGKPLCGLFLFFGIGNYLMTQETNNVMKQDGYK